MTRLFIEGIEVDLTSELSQQVTFAVDDIRKIEAKATSYSKTIILPGTALNNRVFGNVYELTRGNDVAVGGPNSFYDFDASRSAVARLEVNGLLIMKGIARLLSIKREGEAIEYEVALFGELGGFMSAIGTLKLEDLDFSAYDHNYTEANIKASWPETSNSAALSSISGPFSSTIYNPPITYIRFQIPGQVAWIRTGEQFEIFSSAFNDGFYTAYDVFYNSPAGQTWVIVQISPGQPFTPEGAGGTIKKSRTWGTGYAYPLIDYGVSDAPGFPVNQDFRNFRPALFVREYMAKIIEGAGFTWESPFFETPLFRRLVIPNNDARLEKRGTTQYVNAESNATNFFQAHPVYTGGSTPNNLTKINALDFNNINTSVSFNPVVILFSPQGGFQYTGATTASIKISVFIDINLVNIFDGNVSFAIMRKRSNTTDELIRTPAVINFSGRYTNTIEANTAAQPGDIFYVEYKCFLRESRNPPPPFEVVANGLISRLTIDQDPPGWIPFGYGDLIEINKTIPKNIYQKDFFVSIIKMFNLMVTEDSLRDRHLKLTPYIDFYNPDPTTYIDWSYKVARDRPWIIKPMSEANARLYDFKYKEDTDYFNESYKKKWNELYGNKTFDNKLEFSKDKAAVEIIFSPSILVGYDGEDKIFPAIYKYDVNANKKTAQGHNIRILQLRYFNEVEPWRIYNETTPVSGNIPDYLYGGHFDNPSEPLVDINFGVTRELFYTLPSTGNIENNLFFLFYSPYMAEIIDRDSKLLTCETFLSERDITKLDFSRFVTIDGALFRLQKVIDWTSGELCKAELLRIINTTYPLPAPVNASLFRMRFNNMPAIDALIGGSRYLVADWNAFLGSSFASVFIEGDTVTLVGYGRFGIIGSAFKNCQILTHIYDDAGVVDVLYGSCFADCGELLEARFRGLLKMYDSDFTGCVKLISFKAPKLRSMGNEAFRDCIRIKYFDFSSLAVPYYSDDFCGQDLTNNDVFGNISGQTIEMYLSFTAYGKNDADIIVLISNNNVQLILV